MNESEELNLIDRHLAGVLTADEEERLEHLIRTSPDWAQRYREAEDLARLVHKGLGGGAPAPAAVKRTIRRRIARQSATSRPARFVQPTWLTRPAWLTRSVGLAIAAVVVLAFGSWVWWFTSDQGPAEVMTAAFPDEPLAFKDLARRSDVAIEATTVMREGRVRVRPDRVLYGEVGVRGIAVPAELTAGHKIALFGQYDGSGMIRPVEAMRGIVHLDGVQRWEGQDRQPAESRALVGRAEAQRSLAESLADLESFLASDDSQQGERAGLVFSADVTARYLGAFEFEAIVQPLVKLVLNADKHPAVRNAAAEGLERSNRSLACEVLLRSMAGQPMAMLQAESEDGQVVLGCLGLLARSGAPSLAPTLKKVVGMLQAPALREAAQAALDAVLGQGDRVAPKLSVSSPLRFDVGGRECIVMSGAGTQRGLLVVFRGTERVSAFRPVFNAAIARGFGVLVVPQGVRDIEACLDYGKQSGRVVTPQRQFFSHWTAAEEVRNARSLPWTRSIEMLDPSMTPDPLRTPAEVLAETDLDAFFSS